MGGIKWNFLVIATLAAASIIGMGVSLGERSLLGIFIFFILLMGVTGYGFKTKKKMREQGKI